MTVFWYIMVVKGLTVEELRDVLVEVGVDTESELKITFEDLAKLKEVRRVMPSL